MRTSRSLTVSRRIQEGSLPTPHPDADLPWMQNPLDADPLGRPHLDADPPRQTPWSCEQLRMLGSRHPSPCQTNICENITLPQISFAGGNEKKNW